MEALTKKGYDVNYSWGMGVHSHNMGGAMLPEMMRWLWRDQPVSLDPRDTVESAIIVAGLLLSPAAAGQQAAGRGVADAPLTNWNKAGQAVPTPPAAQQRTHHHRPLPADAASIEPRRNARSPRPDQIRSCISINGSRARM